MTSPTLASATDTARGEQLYPRISRWYAENARNLPWRRAECSAWGVMVSEFMLQQTPVARVLPVWQEWMHRWRTPADLASAEAGDAVRAWGRLGYPRRAQRLHAAARAIVENHGGAVPDTYDELLALPGVGSYTAAAIAAFAYGRRTTVIDTNIRRVQARAISGKALPHKSLTAAETRLAQRLLPADRQASCLWNVAIMELGALVCTAKNPACNRCPIEDACAWVRAGKPAADYTPRGQAWHGTDRQLRGAMMAVLRAAHAPVPKELLVDFSPDLFIPANLNTSVTALRKLGSGQVQIQRCYTGLLDDKLAQESDGLVSL